MNRVLKIQKHVCGCTLYGYKNGNNQAHTGKCRSGKVINLDIKKVMHIMFIEKRSPAITTKHVSFDARIHPLVKHNQYITFDRFLGNVDNDRDGFEP